MFIRLTACLATALLLAVFLLAGCADDNDMVVARVGNQELTQSDLMAKMSELPAYAQRQYATPEGLIEFTTRMLDEEVMYQAAARAGYDKDPDVVRNVEGVRRRAMIQAYYAKEIEAEAVVPEENVEAYYNENDELFRRPASLKFRQIMTSSRADALAIRARLLRDESFAAVAREASEDKSTSGAGGLMRSVNLGSSLPEAGMSKEFIEKLFDLTVGTISEPLRSDRGWHIVRVEEKREAGKKEYDEVRDLIIENLRPRVAREMYDRRLEELKAKYNATVNEDAFRAKTRSEEELFTLAQSTDDALKRLNLYSELVFNYPKGEHADEAQFMIGFIHAEELKDYDPARNAFRRLLEMYPETELKDAAQWMLDNMGKEDPPFEDPGTATTE